MTRPMPRSLAAFAALLLLSFAAVLPTASATAEPDGVQVACPLLPAWDAAFCWVGVALVLANYAYDVVTCDVVGGPACGFNVCEDTNLCSTDEE